MPPTRSRPPRLFVPEPSAYEGERPADLPVEEARHVATVLRGKAGDRVELFDGAGRRVEAELVDVAKRRVTARAVGAAILTPPPDTPLTLAVAAPKGDRFRWLVEKATELGVDRLRLITTERSIVDPGDGKLEKAAAAVVAACKQSGRDRLMAIDPPVPWERVVAEEAGGNRWIASPEADATPPVVVTGETRGTSLDAPPRLATQGYDDGPVSTPSLRVDAVTCAIGPEGGWSDAELKTAMDAGWRPVSLGPHVLRVETAAIAIAAIVGVGRGH